MSELTHLDWQIDVHMFENGLGGDLIGIYSSPYLRETALENMNRQISDKKIMILNKLIKSVYYIYFLYSNYA